MLFRPDGDGVIAIAQPSHSWLSGQLVRAWGNARFAAPSPYPEACLGAEQHDIGWLDWEAAPTLDPETGRPHDFRAVGTAVHADLWTRGVQLVLAFGRYPALLVSLHANTVYGSFFDFDQASPEDARTARELLAAQHAFQAAALAALAADPRYAAHATPETVERNRLLVGATDRISLEICWGIGEEARVPDLPATGSDRVELRTRARRGDPGDLILDPWPFTADRIEAVCEGRRLPGRFAEEAEMRRALAEAERVVLATRFRPT